MALEMEAGIVHGYTGTVFAMELMPLDRRSPLPTRDCTVGLTNRLEASTLSEDFIRNYLRRDTP